MNDDFFGGGNILALTHGDYKSLQNLLSPGFEYSYSLTPFLLIGISKRTILS